VPDPVKFIANEIYDNPDQNQDSSDKDNGFTKLMHHF
jgi:hypothetical protein